jgi:hypothetical protein
MTSLRGQTSWAKMTSLRGKLTAPACHLTKFVNKAEYRTFLSTNIDLSLRRVSFQNSITNKNILKIRLK